MRRLEALVARAARLVLREQGKLRVRRVPLRLPHWPVGRLRVAVASDFHAGAPDVDEQRLGEIAAVVVAQRPDLVLLPGDFIDREVALADPVSHERIAEELGRIRAPLGVFAVLGNHDWTHDGRRMAAALRGAGIRVLENEAVEVDGRFWIAALGDEEAREADLEGTLAQVPEGAPVIVLAHNPDVFPRVPARVALTVAGHTHGVQVDVPLLRDRVTPSRYGARYAGGHVEEGGRHLYVSTGIGTSRLPIRFRAKPEVAVLELDSA